MHVRYMTVSSESTAVTAYTCPAGKIAKVRFLALYARLGILWHSHLGRKSLKVGGFELIHSFLLGSEPAKPQPDYIRMLGFNSTGDKLGADVPKEAYLNAGESLVVCGYSSQVLTVMAQIFEESI